MGILHDLLLETRAANFEKDLKEVYGMGFRDGRLRPAELRPCEVKGKPALFHAWASREDGLLKINAFVLPDEAARINKTYRDTGYIPSFCTLEKLSEVRAIVEWPDGFVALVPVEYIRFTDREGGDVE